VRLSHGKHDRGSEGKKPSQSSKKTKDIKKNFSDVTDAIAKDITGQYVLIFSPAAVNAANPRALRIRRPTKIVVWRLQAPSTSAHTDSGEGRSDGL
jgi:hypothetical protein